MGIGDDGDMKGYGALTSALNSKSFMESYLDKMKFPSSPKTPTSVLPNYSATKSSEDCEIVSFSPPLLLPLRRKAIKKLSPIDVKRLSIHMYPHVAQQVANNTFNRIEESKRNFEVIKDYVALIDGPPRPPPPPPPPPPSVSRSRIQTPHPPPQAPPPPPLPPPLLMASQDATVTNVSPPPLAPRIPVPPPPPAAPMTLKSISPPPPMKQGRGGDPLSPSPLTSSTSKTPLPPPPPPPMSTSRTQTPCPPLLEVPPPPTSTFHIVTPQQPPPPPPPPPMASRDTTMTNLSPLPLAPRKPGPPSPPPAPITPRTIPPPPPPMQQGKGDAPPPPPPVGGTRSLRAKATTKLKRSSQMRSLYRLLKWKVEGSSLDGKSLKRTSSKVGAVSGGSGKQGMADALAEMTKRSSYFIQIEEDVKNYANSIQEVKAALSPFQTTDMAELIKFHTYVESLMEKLTDETQVLARFEDFPSKKLEGLRMAAALYAKLDTVVTTLQNWKIESPANQLIDKVENYFNKIKGDLDTLERTKDDELKKFKSQNIHFDFGILLRIKELMVEVSSNCMELALKETREPRAKDDKESGVKSNGKKKGSGKILWKSFQFAFRVYTFAGGQDDRADNLTRELAQVIETDPQQ